MRIHGKWHSVLTIAIVMLVGLAFLLTNVPLVQQVIARASSMPYYCSDKAGVCLLTVYEGDQNVLLDIAKRAAEANVPLTIGITAQQLSEFPQIAEEILALGHVLALHGLEVAEGESKTQWQMRSTQALNDFEAITQYSHVLYIPYLGQHTSEASKFCCQNDVYCLLYCKDSRMYQAISQQDFAQTLAHNAQEGDFIYIGIDTTTEFSAISWNFARENLSLDTVMNVLFD